ncbi:alpha/beta hydrolase [Cellulomonas hominis]|uniref:alpha/beta hydrolase n=1 Tax=Cellulomonas hominis TaxID=156981 RepID=UPI001BCD1DE8|nr:alpha/beta-hydrolase family protein [Cellulomonas hominis]
MTADEGPRRRRLRPRPLHGGGLVVGVVFAVLAMTPSLLPRDWLFQGLVSGISGAIGYGVGVLLAWLLRRSSRWRALVARVDARVPPQARRWVVPALCLAGAAALLIVLAVAARWQRELTDAMGMPATTTSGWLRAAPVLVLVAAVLIAVARGIRLVSRAVAGFLRRRLRLPGVVASVVGAVLVGLAVLTVLNDVVLTRVLSVVDEVFAAANTEDHPGVEQPQDAGRSGSPGSLAAWDTLGREGRRFVAQGPSPEALAASPAGAVADPIRVYAGLDTAADPAGRAEVAVAELERTGAFEREVLLVVTTTGSGWVNEAAVEPLELMYGGDTATVATQYSYLPSWLSFLVDRVRAEDEAQALFTALESRLDALPAGDRPRLLAYGESLGSFGSESVYDSLADIRERTDGVLWVGPPHANEVWRALVERRDPGTPETAPVYASGLVVRFADETGDVGVPDAPWEDPRVLYLQHRSDPIVWWGPALLLERPDWSTEPAPDRSGPTMTWYPFVSFWQLTFDLVNAKSVPDGHGHNYDGQLAAAWASVAAPDGWDDASTAQLQGALAADG